VTIGDLGRMEEEGGRTIGDSENIRKKIILLQVLQELHKAPKADLKVTGSYLKQTIANLKILKHLKQTNFHEALEASIAKLFAS